MTIRGAVQLAVILLLVVYVALVVELLVTHPTTGGPVLNEVSSESGQAIAASFRSAIGIDPAHKGAARR